jgi:Xaa-Pro aminopeptidase
MNNSEKLQALRNEMKKNNINIYIVPTSDDHHSEYVADCDAYRRWISGFTGSAGTAIITLHEALLWTDNRYFIQAEKELSKDWKLMKAGEKDVPTIKDWLNKKELVGINQTQFSVEDINYYNLKNSKHVGNLIKNIWFDRPEPSKGMISIHDIKYAGKDVKSKIENIRNKLKDDEKLVLTALDEIAWLLNIRGTDIKYCPVVKSYCIVSKQDVTLYVDNKKIDDKLKKYFEENLIMVKEYEEIYDVKDEKYLVDTESCNYHLYKVLKNVTEIESYVKLEKAIKNEEEIKGIVDCHINDGAAFVKYLCWLQHKLENDEYVDEISGAEQLDFFRKQQSHYVGLSFETISAFGSNGAIIHYCPDKKTCKRITKDSLYLIDAGAQYLNGTTDVTRTVHFGIPTNYEKECFTRVLKGHIALASIIYDEDRKMGRKELDILSRQFLWKVGKDYEHDTSHGVGSYLLVHEYLGEEYRENMILSNEPGYYEEGKFGIRIESLILVQKCEFENNKSNKFNKFETLTIVPIQARLIDLKLLTAEELIWIINYNKFCMEKLKPVLTDSEFKWLEEHIKFEK